MIFYKFLNIFLAVRRPVLALVLCCALSPLTASAQSGWLRMAEGLYKAGKAVTITDEEIAEAVKESVEALDKANKACASNSSYTKRLRRITKGMEEAEGISLNFKVYQTKEINAFACPDGSVRVYSALMDALSDDELLGVIGHEIGHVALRHSKKAWRSALLRSAASDAMGAMSDTWATLSDSAIGTITSVALSAKHSRYHETQADEYGYDFLEQCGKNPEAMISALQKLKQLSEKGSSKYAKWLQAFSSHPDFDERIEHLRNR